MSSETPTRNSSGPVRIPRRLTVIGLAVLAVVLAAGILPRIRQREALADRARKAEKALPRVDVINPVAVPEGVLSLPGNIQAIKETTLNARTDGYLRHLYVDIGSRVRAGQVLAEIESPDVDQQVSQAEAQTAQSRATVGQAQAGVAQQEANVAQAQADAAKQQAGVEQARAQVAASRASLSDARAKKGEAEANVAHARQALAVQKAAVLQAQAQEAQALANYKRVRSLFAEGYAARADAEQALTAYRTSQAQVESAKAAVEAAQADIAAAQQNVASAQAVVESAAANVEAAQKNVNATQGALASAEATVRSTQASVRASRQNVRANQSAVAASQANARRYAVLRSFQKVTAPFDGIITSRGVNEGALISAGGGGGGTGGASAGASGQGLLGIAQTDAVRIQVSVPETFVPAVAEGSSATIQVRELPGRTFSGSVTLLAGALDPASRTRAAEVHLANPDGVLVPGMYAEVELAPAHPATSLRVPGTALVIDADGTRVAEVTGDGKVHYLDVKLGRDFGSDVEVVEGVRAGQSLVDNPADTLVEGTRVRAEHKEYKPKLGRGGRGGGSREGGGDRSGGGSREGGEGSGGGARRGAQEQGGPGSRSDGPRSEGNGPPPQPGR